MAILKNVTVNDTGLVQVARGTTAQRPTPIAGMIRFNTTTNRNEVYDGAKWLSYEGTMFATGGTITTQGGYRVHTFTNVGNTTFTTSYPGVVEVLAVGGGGGGASIGGGGGAGGLRYESQVQLSVAGNYTVTVGGGGAGTPTHPQAASPGGTSNIVGPSLAANLSIAAAGGGRGMSYTNATGTNRGAADGGSGGGGPGGHLPAPLGGTWPFAPSGWGGSTAVHHWLANNQNQTLQNTPTGNNRDQISIEGTGYGAGIQGQGHPGGAGVHGGSYSWASNTTVYQGGGGGGAASSGKPATNSMSNGSGGAGLASQIRGTLGYYGGGGGSGLHGPGTTGHYGLANALGGRGGGGRGGAVGVTGGTGGTNTGGGGGGGLHPSPNAAGPGGPGIVVIRYRDI